MKNIFILLVLSVMSFSAEAHYGPRGLFGGDVICGTHHNGSVFLGTAEGGVYMSANVQLNAWRVRNVGLKSGLVTDLYHNGTFIFVSTSDEGVFIFDGSAGGNDLFWNDRNNGLIHKNVSALGGVKNTARLYAGTFANGLYTSLDEGANWSIVNHPFFNNKHITAIEELDGRIVVATNDAGVFYTDDGTNWSDFNDLNTANLGVSSLSYNINTDELVLVNQNGVLLLSSASSVLSPNYSNIVTGLPVSIEIRSVSNNGGNWYLATNQGVYNADATQPITWTTINTGLTQLDTYVVVALQDDLIVGTEEDGVFKSSTVNHEWASNNTGIHGITNIRVYSIAGLGDTVTATATEKGVAISMESGFNPILRNNGLTDYLNVNDLVFAGESLIAVTQNSGVFITQDLGLNWQSINTGLSIQNIEKVFYSNGDIYVIGNNGKIYKSSLANINWVEYMTGIPGNLNVTSMAFYANWLYAGTFGGGVYAKMINESSWSEFNQCPCGSYSLGNLDVTSLTASAGRLYAGTHGSGVYSCTYDYSNWMETNPIVIPHFDDVTFLQPQFVQHMTSFGGFVLASYRGGAVATNDGGQTWVRAGHQFHIPSFSDVNKISFITNRIMITTQNNNMMSNSVNEFNNLDDTLHVSSVFELIPASGGNTYHSVTTNLEWEVTNISDSWIQVGNMEGFRNGIVDISVDENTSSTSRSGTVTIAAGSFSEEIQISQQGALGLFSNEKDIQVIMYPNPTNGTFTIHSKNQIVQSVNIYNLMGQDVLQLNGLNTHEITVNDRIAQGVYSVEIRTSESVSILKLIVR